MAGNINKALEVVPAKLHWKIQWKGGGEVPQELSGLYTSQLFANKAIELYMESKAKRPVQEK